MRILCDTEESPPGRDALLHVGATIDLAQLPAREVEISANELVAE
jgi:hypothetical protein